MELRTARRIARLTQQELAKLAGVDKSLISRLERGQRDQLRWVSAVRIARALNVEPQELFDIPPGPAGIVPPTDPPDDLGDEKRAS